MIRSRPHRILLLSLLGFAILAQAQGPGLTRYVPTPDEVADNYRRSQTIGQAAGAVYKATFTPNWLKEGEKLWYVNRLSEGRFEYWLVDCPTGRKQPLFDQARLARQLSNVTKTTVEEGKVNLQNLAVTDDLDRVTFRFAGKGYQLGLIEYNIREAEVADLSEPGQGGRGQGRGGQGQGRGRSRRSPDGKLQYELADGRLKVTEVEGGKTVFESKADQLAYANWAPDSRRLAVFRVLPGDHREVSIIQSSPTNGGRAQLRTRLYDLPGDKLDTFETFVIDVPKGTELQSDLEPFFVYGLPWASPPNIRWWNGGKSFLVGFAERGYGAYRIECIDLDTAKHKTLIDERSETFVDTTAMIFNPRPEKNDIIWRSERTGWGRLYRIDGTDGKVLNDVTPDGWVVRTIDWIDDVASRLCFSANGTETGDTRYAMRDGAFINPGYRQPSTLDPQPQFSFHELRSTLPQDSSIANRPSSIPGLAILQGQHSALPVDPYFAHFFTVGLDGKNLVRLTEGHGNHSIRFSPNRKYIVDTYSRLDQAPIHELRRVTDGKLIAVLERADDSEWLKFNIKPEPFVAKGRDGKTDIWGVVYRPSTFDPSKKYPVIENLYAGPQDSFAPHSFNALNPMQRLAELGFIVVQLDGMGTRNRGKAFHDVCYKNLADAGFPDRILWMKALAAKYPQVDIDRVGVYGTSAGGQSSTGALLFHPEFYKVAVSSCGCHDNRMDKMWWNEQWMGKLGPHYEEQSNITNAGKLKGRLMLMVGELDTNVPPESTYRLVDALIKANKDFEFVMLPGSDHTSGGAYGERKRRDFFVRHLLGVDPPVWSGMEGG